MILVKEKLGNLQSFDSGSRETDLLELEWYETGKRILHKTTAAGRAVTLKFFRESQQLRQYDIIYVDARLLISIDIKPCDVILIQPGSVYQLAQICYEIGNKHLPLFFEAEQLMIPYEAPIHRMLQAAGFQVSVENRKLLNQFSTSVTAHAHQGESTSLFSKIMQLTSRSTDV